MSSVALGERLRAGHLTVYVASAPDFTEQHIVADGASDIIHLGLGSDSPHARTSVGVVALPLNSPVEVQGMFVVEATVS
jgi:enamine deaminase RidA (YjgF/YER057c/UK114 family)